MKVLGSALALLLIASPLGAQHAIVVKEKEGFFPVVSVRDHEVVVLKKGKQVVSTSTVYAMTEAKEYLPIHIAVKEMSAKFSYVTVRNDGALNKNLDMYCELESPMDLEDLFMALVVDSDVAGKGIFLCGIDRLEAGKTRFLDFQVPTGEYLGSGHYKVHLFVKGREVFSSMLVPGEMERALKQMISERIKGLQNAPARPFLGPAPWYPKGLYKKRIEGRAVLVFKIGSDGGVKEPSLAEATQPEFGTAALAAIEHWCFFPKVVNGQAVEAKASMPFDFVPPKK